MEDAWADIIVKYHREYCHYTFCIGDGDGDGEGGGVNDNDFDYDSDRFSRALQRAAETWILT